MELRRYRLGRLTCTPHDWHHLPSICYTRFSYPTELVSASYVQPPADTHAVTQWWVGLYCVAVI